MGPHSCRVKSQEKHSHKKNKAFPFTWLKQAGAWGKQKELDKTGCGDSVVVG